MTKILLVEDNEINRDMLSYRLNRRGYELVIAVDGAQAVSLAIAENPDLILMDLSLPIMNGWDATREIKANPNTEHIPIIALTAHAMSGDRQQALEAGCDDYDTKPIEFPRLLKKMQTLLERVSVLQSETITPNTVLTQEQIQSDLVVTKSSTSEPTDKLSTTLVESVEPSSVNIQPEKADIPPAKKEEKLLILSKAIKLVYFVTNSLWSTGDLTKLSTKKAEIFSNKKIEISPGSTIKLRLWGEDSKRVGGEMSAIFLEISKEDNESLIVEFAEQYAQILQILQHQLERI